MLGILDRRDLKKGVGNLKDSVPLSAELDQGLTRRELEKGAYAKRTNEHINRTMSQRSYIPLGFLAAVETTLLLEWWFEDAFAVSPVLLESEVPSISDQ